MASISRVMWALSTATLSTLTATVAVFHSALIMTAEELWRFPVVFDVGIAGGEKSSAGTAAGVVVVDPHCSDTDQRQISNVIFLFQSLIFDLCAPTKVLKVRQVLRRIFGALASIVDPKSWASVRVTLRLNSLFGKIGLEPSCCRPMREFSQVIQKQFHAFQKISKVAINLIEVFAHL